jgi:hypothetical protein
MLYRASTFLERDNITDVMVNALSSGSLSNRGQKAIDDDGGRHDADDPWYYYSKDGYHFGFTHEWGSNQDYGQGEWFGGLEFSTGIGPVFTRMYEFS